MSTQNPFPQTLKKLKSWRLRDKRVKVSVVFNFSGFFTVKYFTVVSFPGISRRSSPKQFVQKRGYGHSFLTFTTNLTPPLLKFYRRLEHPVLTRLVTSLHTVPWVELNPRRNLQPELCPMNTFYKSFLGESSPLSVRPTSVSSFNLFLHQSRPLVGPGDVTLNSVPRLESM